MNNPLAVLGAAVEREVKSATMALSNMPRFSGNSWGAWGGNSTSGGYPFPYWDRNGNNLATTSDYECVADPYDSPLVAALLDKIIRAFNEAPPCLQRLNALNGWDTDRLPDTPQRRDPDTGLYEFSAPPNILDLLYCPNPWWTGNTQFTALLCDRFHRGNAFWFIVENVLNEPLRLLHLPASEIQARRNPAGSSRLIDWYEWRPDGGSTVYTIQPRDMIHFRAEKPAYGQMLSESPLAKLAPHLAVEREEPLYAATMAHNLGRPGIIFIPKSEELSVEPATAERMMLEFEARYTGRNRKKPLVLTEPWTVEVPDFKPEEVVSQFSSDSASAAICLAMGVNPMVAGTILGVKEGNFAALESAVQQFWSDTIIPLNTQIGAELTKFLLPRYEAPKRSVRVAFNLSDVRALSEDLTQRDERAINKYRWNVTTLDAALIEVGHPPEGGDLGKMRYSEFVATQARTDQSPGGGTQMLPSGGGTGDSALAASEDGNRPVSKPKAIFLDPELEPLSLNGSH